MRRLARGWSMGQLAVRSGVTASYIGRLEAGVYDSPGSEKLSAIAAALHMSLADLLPNDQPSAEGSDPIREQVYEWLAADPEIAITIAETGRRWTQADWELVRGLLRAIKKTHEQNENEQKFG
jgi:transcriptional regulator with XRE-family HTH domain